MFGASRDAHALREVAERCLQGTRNGLAVGKRLPAVAGTQSVSDPSQALLLSGPFDGLIWRVEEDLRDGLLRLRPLLGCGARMLVWVETAPSLWEVTRKLVGGRQSPRLSREAVCEALLLSGLENPRVWLDGARSVAVSAQLPAHPDVLDDVFAQPPAR